VCHGSIFLNWPYRALDLMSEPGIFILELILIFLVVFVSLDRGTCSGYLGFTVPVWCVFLALVRLLDTTPLQLCQCFRHVSICNALKHSGVELPSWLGSAWQTLIPRCNDRVRLLGLVKPVGFRGRRWPTAEKKKRGCIRTCCEAVVAIGVGRRNHGGFGCEEGLKWKEQAKQEALYSLSRKAA